MDPVRVGQIKAIRRRYEGREGVMVRRGSRRADWSQAPAQERHAEVSPSRISSQQPFKGSAERSGDPKT